MKTLTEYNQERADAFRINKENKHKAGVLCDECKVEMLFTHPGTVLASWPGMYEVMCPQCKKQSYKTAA